MKIGITERDAKVGMLIGFKADYEQCGTISKLSYNKHSDTVEATIASLTPAGFEGYIEGHTEYTVDIREIWSEEN